MKLDTIPLPLHTGSEHGPEREGFTSHHGFADLNPHQWAPYRVAAWETQDGMQEQKQEYGRPIG